MFTRNSRSPRPFCFLFVPPITPVSSLRSAPCSPPARMSNTCYLTACGPVGLGEAQKASLALPAAALVAYLNQPLPQHSTQDYCLYLICSPNTKLSSGTFFFFLSKGTH